MNVLSLLMTAVLLLILASCSPLTLNQAKKTGDQLTARNIFDLVSGNTLTLSAYDFDGQVYFSQGGKVSGRDNEGMTDTGSWDLKNNNQLCIRFKVWYYGDINCYSIIRDDARNLLSFYTPNGAAYYTGSLQDGDPERLSSQINEDGSSTFLRKRFTAEQQETKAPPLQPEKTLSVDQIDTTGSIRQIAKQCRGCNLSGANLKEAVLVKAQLENADLSKADLRYANLRRARLRGANLSGARLNHANLPGADLRGCNLSGADLTGANLLLADVTDADLTGAILTNAHLENIIGLEK